MELSAEIEEKLQAAASKTLQGRVLIRCLPFIRQGTPMLHVAFKEGPSKEIKLQTIASRDRLCDIFKEQAWAFKKLQTNTGQSQSE